jgi:hypothetical protein
MGGSRVFRWSRGLSCRSSELAAMHAPNCPTCFKKKVQGRIRMVKAIGVENRLTLRCTDDLAGSSVTQHAVNNMCCDVATNRWAKGALASRNTFQEECRSVPFTMKSYM